MSLRKNTVLQSNSKTQDVVKRLTGERFIQHVFENNLAEITVYLTHGVDVNTVSEVGDMTALMVACGRGHSAIVSRLVQEPDLDINLQDEMGYTAVMYACERGYTECVRILAETGRVDWSMRQMTGLTVLDLANNKGRSNIMEIIRHYHPGLQAHIKRLKERNFTALITTCQKLHPTSPRVLMSTQCLMMAAQFS